MLRLRASYGYSGNTNNATSALATIAYEGVNPYTNTPYADPYTFANPGLTWEQVRTLNLGIDFSALKGRLSGSLDWYSKKSDNLIANVPIDQTISQQGTITKNAASLSGHGMDLLLTSNNLAGKVKWTTTLNFSYSRTIVTKYYSNIVTTPATFTGINPQAGKIAWGIYSYKWAGLDPSTGDPQGYLKGKVSKDYTSIINDSFQNQVLNGSSVPLYFGNILNTFTWNNLSLSFNLSYRLSYYFVKPTISYSNLFNNWVTNSDFERRWQKPGDEKNTTVPSMVYPANIQRDAFYAGSSVNVMKGDNLRLQDIRLAYLLENHLGHKYPFKSIQFYLYAYNLNWLVYRANKFGIDPDYSLTSLLPAKSWAAGINLNF